MATFMGDRDSLMPAGQKRKRGGRRAAATTAPASASSATTDQDTAEGNYNFRTFIETE